jgi:transcriptional regulator with XRE-family HTH domain
MASDLGRTAATQAAELLRCEREEAGLTQQQVARRAGVARSTVAAYETGGSTPSLAAIDRVLGAFGKQLRLETEPIAADIDAAIDMARGMSMDERVEQHAWRLPMMLKHLVGVPYVAEGAVAAFVQGAPLPVDAMEIAMTDLDVLNERLEKARAQRWNPRWRDWGFDAIDPRRDGPMRWITMYGELRVRAVDELPPAVEVAVGEWQIPVRPLVDIEAADPAMQRILARLRQRLRSPHDQ